MIVIISAPTIRSSNVYIWSVNKNINNNNNNNCLAIEYFIVIECMKPFHLFILFVMTCMFEILRMCDEVHVFWSVRILLVGSSWLICNTLASDASYPGSTRGSVTRELDTGSILSRSVKCEATSKQLVTAVKHLGCKLGVALPLRL